MSVPRLAAIEHPLGYLLGLPGDRAGQLTVLRATLSALAEMTASGEIRHLPYEWPASAQNLNANPLVQPPISGYLLKHPWQIRNLFSRRIPAKQL